MKCQAMFFKMLKEQNHNLKHDLLAHQFCTPFQTDRLVFSWLQARKMSGRCKIILQMYTLYKKMTIYGHFFYTIYTFLLLKIGCYV